MITESEISQVHLPTLRFQALQSSQYLEPERQPARRYGSAFLTFWRDGAIESNGFQKQPFEHTPKISGLYSHSVQESMYI